jgi:hypothetical protein
MLAWGGVFKGHWGVEKGGGAHEENGNPGKCLLIQSLQLPWAPLLCPPGWALGRGLGTQGWEGPRVDEGNLNLLVQQIQTLAPTSINVPLPLVESGLGVLFFLTSGLAE